MGTRDAVLGIVEEIYAAAEDATRWRNVVEACAAAVCTEPTGLYSHNLTSGTATFSVAINCDPAYLRTYEAHYASVDAWSATAARRNLFRPGEVLTSDSILSRRDLLRSEYYADWLHPQGIERAANICIASEKTFVANMSLMRKTDREFSAEDVRLLQAITPHLQRGLRLHHELFAARAQREELTDVLDRMPVAVMLLNAEGEVTYATRRAEIVLAANDGLAVHQKRLELSSARATAELRELVGQASGRNRAAPRHAGGAFLCERRSLRAPYELLITPIGSAEAKRVAIFITDPAAIRSHETSVWRDLYHLTPTEILVATAILTDATVEDVARSLGVTRNTVKTHMKRILAKTETSNRAQLVQRLLSGVSVISRAV